MQHVGAIYYAQPDGSSIREVVFPRESPNGIGLSPDGTRLYAAETHTGRVYAWNVDRARARSSATPAGAAGALLCGLPGMQLFDSLGVDGDGNVVVGNARHGRAHRDLARRARCSIRCCTGDPMATNVCFGGDDLPHRVRHVLGDRPARLDAVAAPGPAAQLLSRTTRPVCGVRRGRRRRVACSAWDRLQESRSSSWPGSGRARSPAMLLSDMGADIVRVDRAAAGQPGDFDKPNLEPLYRGRRSIGVDLKNPEGVELVLRLVEQADALFEGFRPGVTERLGLGPDVCLARNPKLVYGRMTGWGQDGPMAQAAGHDINYIALAGALAHFGRAGQQADAADQPRRRLRRRRHVHGVRHRVRRSSRRSARARVR